jgi:hypothetical protein
MGTTGVFPVHNNIFKVNTAGRAGGSGTLVIIKDLETFSPSIDGNTEEWTPMDQAGWIRRMVTGKGLTFSFSGKRNYGDPGNDYIAGLLLGTGQDVETVFEWTLPSGAVLTMNCIIDLQTPAGGDSTNVDTLEFDLLSDGLPVFTPSASALAELTFVCSDGTEVGATQIASVSPVLGGLNSYFYKINGALPAGGESIVGKGWTAYTLAEDILTSTGNFIALVEVVTATNLAVKGGVADVVIV